MVTRETPVERPGGFVDAYDGEGAFVVLVPVLNEQLAGGRQATEIITVGIIDAPVSKWQAAESEEAMAIVGVWGDESAVGT